MVCAIRATTTQGETMIIDIACGYVLGRFVYEFISALCVNLGRAYREERTKRGTNL